MIFQPQATVELFRTPFDIRQGTRLIPGFAIAGIPLNPNRMLVRSIVNSVTKLNRNYHFPNLLDGILKISESGKSSS